MGWTGIGSDIHIIECGRGIKDVDTERCIRGEESQKWHKNDSIVRFLNQELWRAYQGRLWAFTYYVTGNESQA